MPVINVVKQHSLRLAIQYNLQIIDAILSDIVMVHHHFIDTNIMDEQDHALIGHYKFS